MSDRENSERLHLRATNIPEQVKLEYPVCDCCGEKRHRPLFQAGDRDYGLPGQYWYVQCVSCDLVYLFPRPNEQTIGYYYPDNYYCHDPASVLRFVVPKDKTHLNRIDRWKVGIKQELLKFYLPQMRPKLFYLPLFLRQLRHPHHRVIWWKRTSSRRALDVGCGNGWFLAQLSLNYGWEVYGIEPEPRKACAYAIDVLGMDIYENIFTAPFPWAYFDLITFWMILEHVHSPLAVLKRCHKLLKPNGIILVNVPNWNCIARRVFGVLWNDLQAPIHLYHFTPATLTNVLRRAGFRTLFCSFRQTDDFARSLSHWLAERKLCNNPSRVYPYLARLCRLADILQKWFRVGGSIIVVATPQRTVEE